MNIYVYILIMFTILIAQQLTAVKARYLWVRVGSVVLYVSMAGHMIFNTVHVEHES